MEWPTLALVGGAYSAWLALTYFHAALPWWIVSLVGAVLLALHSSLQHEMLHGHPTFSRRLNCLLATPPLSLWLPFESYRISHLIHHRDERLTDPLDDPESRYWTEAAWQRLGPIGHTLILAQSTLLGRMILGPAWNVACFWCTEAGALWRGEGPARRIWLAHIVHLVPVVLWLVFVARMDLAFYVFAIVYPGTSILLIRSFAEHRAEASVIERTAIVENARLLGPLFLFNNLHVVHHSLPTLPWYAIPEWYRQNRERLIRENGGLVYASYFDVARRYLFRPHDAVAHPFGRAPLADGAALSDNGS
ncbi:fatty acid desaturase [Kaistia algarum]|uniref:fatty acid desaturase n=1 Tax=Kaistia algarum TaxID=2083279 RepID=UPI002259B486|nr:fatty acid desaturase [Kaistia algarum]MCX5512655.1 fatty acid desaturase [Kaistia algarum]